MIKFSGPRDSSKKMEISKSEVLPRVGLRMETKEEDWLIEELFKLKGSKGPKENVPFGTDPKNKGRSFIFLVEEKRV
jgi:hypothetical protein